jgi:hypothetical protein
MDLLGQPIYLAGKPKGDKSMSEKQTSVKVWSVVRSASPVRMVKPELVEPEFSVAQPAAHRSIPDAVTSQYVHMQRLCMAIRRRNPHLQNALCDERPSVRGLKGMSRDLERTTRLTGVNAGWPKSRKTHGHGAPIVRCVSNGRGRTRRGLRAPN